jgi:hypothetical protein
VTRIALIVSLLVASVAFALAAMQHLMRAAEMERTAAHVEASDGPPTTREERSREGAFDDEMNQKERVGLGFGAIATAAATTAWVLLRLGLQTRVRPNHANTSATRDAGNGRDASN